MRSRFLGAFVVEPTGAASMHSVGALPERFVQYGLTLHPEKTRVVNFTRPRGGNPEDDGKKTFNFLGFTHYWGISRKGAPLVVRSTQKERFARAFKKVAEWCKKNRHEPVREQHKALNRKLQGHYAYYGITNNVNQVANFRHQVIRLWRKWLMRRTRGKWISWDDFQRMLTFYPLARARIIHRYA